MKNRFKYLCADCKAESWHFKHEFIRASRPHCPGCGSTFLDPVTKEARERGQLGQNAAINSNDLRDSKMGKVAP